MIQRYRCEDTSIAGLMRPDENGDWVRYADIEKWVATSERLPVIGQRVAVLVHDGEGLTAYTDYLAADRFWHAYVSAVEFWMPLPPLPEPTDAN